jgi:hypothetical protein
MSRQPQSRARMLGVKPGQMRRHSLSRIDRAKALIAEIAVHWDDVDSAVAFDADLAVQELERLEGGIEAAVDLLKAPAEDNL